MPSQPWLSRPGTKFISPKQGLRTASEADGTALTQKVLELGPLKT